MPRTALPHALALPLWIALLALALPSAAGAEEPPPAQASFQRFAANWMRVTAADAERQRNEARFLSRTGAGWGRAFTYRAVSEDFTVRVKTTGRPASPYVGILRYTEQVFRCEPPEPEPCGLVETRPITEIFPFVEGRWHY